MTTSVSKSSLGRILVAALAPVLFLFSNTPASGQGNRVVVRMASLAPANSPWHDALMVMRERWREASNGKVILQVIPSAQGGEEEDVLRKMKYGQFQAGTFTLAGLQNLTPACVVLAIPTLAETQEDLHRIRAAVGPELERVFKEKGYVLLHWADLGWMRFFVPDPDPSPAAVAGHTYVQWGDDSMSRIWRSVGFRPGVRLNLADITVGLQNGQVEAINSAPLVVAGYQWFSYLPYMIDIPWAPLSGATLIDLETWERIDEGLRPVLKQIAEEVGKEIQTSLLQWERDVIQQMRDRAGVQVIRPPPEVLDEWRRLFERSWDLLRGDVIPEAWFDLAVRVGREGRAR